MKVGGQQRPVFEFYKYGYVAFFDIVVKCTKNTCGNALKILATYHKVEITGIMCIAIYTATVCPHLKRYMRGRKNIQ